MSLAKNFNRALHRELAIYAAWFPVSNVLKLGDYGLIEHGVFRAMGNISSYGINFDQASGPPATIDFMSSGASLVKTVANVEVDSLPQVGDLEAKLTFNFKRENSCLIKATLTVDQMQTIDQVARELKRLDDWERRFKVVSAVYTGMQCMILATRKANTEIVFAGKVDVLQQIELGKLEVKPSMTSSSEVALKVLGDTGVVGLRLFKLGFFTGRADMLGGYIGDDDESEIEEDWGEDLEDDL